MAIVVLNGGQSSAAAAGQTPAYIRGLALQQLPGCPDTLVDSHLQLVLKKFYTFTTGWRAVLGPYAVQALNDTVFLNPIDQSSQLQFVHCAWLYPVLGGNARQFLHPAGRKVIGNDKNLPSSFFMQSPDTLVFYPVPDKAYGNTLFVQGSLIPTPNAAQLPNITFTHHLDAILSGVLARLYRMPKKPWTDLALAAEHDRSYRREMLVWRNHAERNYGPRDIPTIFPPFAGRGSQMSVKSVLG